MGSCKKLAVSPAAAAAACSFLTQGSWLTVAGKGSIKLIAHCKPCAAAPDLALFAIPLTKASYSLGSSPRKVNRNVPPVPFPPLAGKSGTHLALWQFPPTLKQGLPKLRCVHHDHTNAVHSHPDTPPHQSQHEKRWELGCTAPHV